MNKGVGVGGECDCRQAALLNYFPQETPGSETRFKFEAQ